MTAVWRSGAEIAPHGITTEFTGGALANASQDSTIKRSGSYSLKFTGPGHTGSTKGLNLQGVAARTYIYLAGTPTTASPVVGTWGPGGSVQACLQLNTDRTLSLYLGYAVTLVATSGFPVPTGSFAEYLELWVDRSTNTVATRYNGIEWARASVPASALSDILDAAWFGPASGLGTAIHYDDMAINSLTGANNNGWPGPSAGGVLTFRPNASLTTPGWTVNGAPTVHECLDDLAPDMTDTCIIQSGGPSGAGADAWLYFPAWPAAVPASCVHIGMSGYADSTSSIALDIRDPANAQAVVVSTLTPSWTAPRYPFATLERAWDGTRRLLNNGYLMPASGARWVVLITRQDGIAAVQYVSALWMTVDFPLALAAAPVPPPGAPGAANVYQTHILAEIVNP